ncbi:hypothetical protein Godav_011532 [Gossypium davidsonii]|uniref:Uncharacterized protein n=1 Tax=Gossypium davidsonii TaxID=34287 RepID=A0A7J8RBJ8_GOSDV|nr:hypothetical protein [Gossypium davidsonii]
MCLYKHFCQVFVPSTRPIEEFLESEWPPNQSIEEWVQNLSSLNSHIRSHQLFLIDGTDGSESIRTKEEQKKRSQKNIWSLRGDLSQWNKWQ